MDRKQFLGTLAGAALALTGAESPSRGQEGVFPKKQDVSAERVQWVARSLARMQTIAPGKTRADLMKVFTTEGGLSTRTRQVFVYRECPYFKVEVEFKPDRVKLDEQGHDTLPESPGDVIVKVSQPYLEFTIAD